MHAWLATIEINIGEYHNVRELYYALPTRDITEASREVERDVSGGNERHCIGIKYLGPLYCSINCCIDQHSAF